MNTTLSQLVYSECKNHYNREEGKHARHTRKIYRYCFHNLHIYIVYFFTHKYKGGKEKKLYFLAIESKGTVTVGYT